MVHRLPLRSGPDGYYDDRNAASAASVGGGSVADGVAPHGQPICHSMNSPMPKLLVENVSKQFPTRAEPLVVLDRVSLELAAGENVAIVGPSGSGKSTLLSVIGTLEPPTAGRVTLDGQDPFGLDEPGLARFRSRNIGFVFQDHYLLPQCSVLENVLVPTMAAGGTSAESVRRGRALLDRVGLGNRLDHRPAELSGGERQRAALARALVNRPMLLLADEPTGNLDRATGTRVGELLLELQQQERMMLIVVTHSARLAEMMSPPHAVGPRTAGGGMTVDGRRYVAVDGTEPRASDRHPLNR